MYEYLWHIHIGSPTMSLFTFNDLCQNVLKLVGTRLVSLRVTLTNAIGGWSLVSSSLKYHQTTLLQRLHLINITPHEFDNLLRNPFIKGLHTLLVDATSSNPFHYFDGEGVYLTKVCSQLPLLTNCRLPFNVYHKGRYDADKYSALSIMNLPSLLNTIHLRSLTIGMNTSRFLKRLISCIPFIENLSVGVKDLAMNQNESFDIVSLPTAVDARLLLYLSRLHINCKDGISFHRAIALLSSVFGQLRHLSLKLETDVVISSPMTISGDIIQELCIDRLNPGAIYNLNLDLHVQYDAKEKIIFSSFLTAPFTNRQRPKVFIQELVSDEVDHYCHYFTVFTLPCYERKLPTYMFSRALEKSCPIPIHAVDLFPRANELFLHGYRNENCVLELGNITSSISSLVPWSLLTKISIDNSDVVTIAELESILRMASNVHTLQVWENTGIFRHAIIHNINNLGTLINQQVQTLEMHDVTLTWKKSLDFCKLLSNQLPNLKRVFFSIHDSYLGLRWTSLPMVDRKNKSTERILKLIYFLVVHLQQLVSLHINFINLTGSKSSCYPHLIKQQVYQYLIRRPYRLRCDHGTIEMWL
ncbi:unnamed protein product [Rotaria sp. Silwood2]|nr:unnamed protein product [Rotaria sp. Silwood2]CAF4552497.1 unnamed protein product [Rotaria sp. Silwood2]CAF4560904.1 unnamed protein product [Rotaria sp. Silwood2]